MHAITLLFIGFLTLVTVTKANKVVCYYGSWAAYRPGNGKFDVSDIDPTLCTHLIYTFVGITEEGEIRVLDPALDLPDNGGKDGIGRFNKLREISPKTKTMIAIGGWNEGSVKYSKVVNNETTRKKFAENVVAFVKKYGFNGFDIDWEYPNQRNGTETDKTNFVILLKDLREKFDQENLILSIAVAAFKISASKSYVVSEVCKYPHFINLLTYDVHGTWDNNTGLNAPLYAGSWETGAERDLNIDSAVHYWLNQGAPADKLILGMPLYGRGFTLDDPNVHGIGAPAHQPSIAGPYTREAGVLSYNEICEKLKNETWNVVFDNENRAPYAYSGNQWVGYDNPRSLKEKTLYLKKLGLGGAMVWSVESDDFKGICGNKYPLLKSIVRNIY